MFNFKNRVLDGAYRVLMKLSGLLDRAIWGSFSLDRKQVKPHSLRRKFHSWHSKLFHLCFGLIMRNREERSRYGYTKVVLGFPWKSYLRIGRKRKPGI